MQVPGDRPALGIRMLSGGLVSPEQLGAAVSEQRERFPTRLIGQMLIRMGFVSADLIDAFVREQVPDQVADLLDLPVEVELQVVHLDRHAHLRPVDRVLEVRLRHRPSPHRLPARAWGRRGRTRGTRRAGRRPASAQPTPVPSSRHSGSSGSGSGPGRRATTGASGSAGAGGSGGSDTSVFMRELSSLSDDPEPESPVVTRLVVPLTGQRRKRRFWER
jgi:uncharacterized membrane protein YgcG